LESIKTPCRRARRESIELEIKINNTTQNLTREIVSLPFSLRVLCALRGKPSKVNNLNLRIGHIGEVSIFNEINHLIQGGIDPLPVISNRTDP
jgi:hypothetical protein